MTQVVTPSEMTTGQVGKFQELLAAALRKARLPSEPVQQVLMQGADAVIAAAVAELRRRVDAVSDLIVRHVRVNRARSPKEAIAACKRREYLNDGVVKAMPKGSGDESEMVFFKVGRWISDADLDKEYELRGLVPADPYSLAAVNEEDPAFADEVPNATHWEDKDGYCYAAFLRWGGERDVVVDRDDGTWYGRWWFAGFRKTLET